ncbi:hypothetical protein [Labrenzia sp. VG12]|uniref:hypothetical protein n=1 Tax=Labrenzia sp. VG12 TaxID=2021862 RepID=UPI000B8BDED9|nr:hypothetical protein [Labrenzia sp. VG12]ASP32241.1 hypothetical protein CHH27_02450 [Labrenzia sp. VG12]
MDPVSLKTTQWLTVQEIADLWSPQLSIPASTILRELRFALYKLEKDYPYNEPLKELPPEEELPSVQTLIDRDFIERFNDKQIWKLPEFWFANLPTGPSFPGRPSIMNAIVQELERRYENEEMLDTLAAESRVLEAWASENHSGQQTPKTSSIENGIRTVYRQLKRGPK